MAEMATELGETKALDSELAKEKMSGSSETAAEQTTSEQKAIVKEDSAQQLDQQAVENSTKPDPLAIDDTKPKTPSKNVQEGRAWNNRDRGRGGRGRGGYGDYPKSSFKHNIKSDLTTQEESSDPVAIRKQVQYYIRSGTKCTLTSSSRSNSTFRTRIFTMISFSLSDLVAIRISQFQ